MSARHSEPIRNYAEPARSTVGVRPSVNSIARSRRFLEGFIGLILSTIRLNSRLVLCVRMRRLARDGFPLDDCSEIVAIR